MVCEHGLDWLTGGKWAAITREERFFCAVLYQHASKDPTQFAKWLIDKAGLDISPSGSWDIGYEVCFYRDYLWSQGTPVRTVKKPKFPSKRTFDLCLFGETAIIIIEAKVCEKFSANQNADFEKDRSLIKQLPGLEHIDVKIVALATSTYFQKLFDSDKSHMLAVFDGKRITWTDAAKEYGDPLLARADKMYALKSGELSRE